VAFIQRLGHPYVLLTLCVLFWSANFVVGRAVSGDIPPIALSFWRWVVASLVLLPWAIKPLKRQWPLLRQYFWRMCLLSLLGVTAFNTLVYIGLQETSAINALLLQSTMPVQIIALNWLIYRKRSSLGDGVSILLSLLGVSFILGAGEPLKLLQGQWSQGDLWVLAAVLVWALYSLFLRWRPVELEPMTFLGFILPFGTLAIFPLWLWELSTGAVTVVSQESLLAIAYVGVFPSVFSYLLWNRGVAEVGANRAGHFIHLNPVFGSLLAIVFLDEIFEWYHALGAGLVALAIGMTLLFTRKIKIGEGR